MSMDYIRDHYRVPARRGGQIVWQPYADYPKAPRHQDRYRAEIVSAPDMHLRARITAAPQGADYQVGQVVILHPTDGITYLDAHPTSGRNPRTGHQAQPGGRAAGSMPRT